MALAHAHGPGHDQPFSRKEASTLGLPSRFWLPPPLLLPLPTPLL